jgi:hypothetical protein
MHSFTRGSHTNYTLFFIHLYPKAANRPPPIMNGTHKDWRDELDEFERRLKIRQDVEKYASWHPKNVILHPARTLRLAFGIIGDGDMERALAHMDKGTGNSKPKPKSSPRK